MQLFIVSIYLNHLYILFSCALRFPMGFIKAACDFSTALWQPRFMPGWNADFTTGAVRSVADINAGDGVTGTAADAVVCDEWVDHPVLIVQRDTFANFFHDRLVLSFLILLCEAPLAV